MELPISGIGGLEGEAGDSEAGETDDIGLGGVDSDKGVLAAVCASTSA